VIGETVSLASVRQPCYAAATAAAAADDDDDDDDDTAALSAAHPRCCTVVWPRVTCVQIAFCVISGLQGLRGHCRDFRRYANLLHSHQFVDHVHHAHRSLVLLLTASFPFCASDVALLELLLCD